jgi:hypothetical protein
VTYIEEPVLEEALDNRRETYPAPTGHGGRTGGLRAALQLVAQVVRVRLVTAVPESTPNQATTRLHGGPPRAVLLPV